MAPKGLYSVQKSRSFGGVNKYSDTSNSIDQQGQKTPNFDSLRKKFSKKKTTSFDDDDGDYVDGATSTLKKKNKGVSRVGNILKWFRKDNSNNSKEHQAFLEQESLTPKIRRLVQKQSEGSKIIPFRSSSYDSVCSIASAASSFAFVPVDAYKIGRYVESNKKIAIGINCGQDTYRRRLEQRENGLETDKELTLKTKYNLLGSESPPKKSDAAPVPRLPTGPLLPLSEIHRNDDTNSSSSDTDTATSELESISQRGSLSQVRPQWSGPRPKSGQASVDQQRENKNNTAAADNKNASPVQSIKPRELTGQLLHPTTIKVSGERAECVGRDWAELLPLTGQQGTKVVPAPSQPANNFLRDPELLPKNQLKVKCVQSFIILSLSRAIHSVRVRASSAPPTATPPAPPGPRPQLTETSDL